MSRRETYAQARERLLAEAEHAGLEVQRKANVAPWQPLRAPRIRVRVDRWIEIRAQSVGVHCRERGRSHERRSLWFDIRDQPLSVLLEVARA